MIVKEKLIVKFPEKISKIYFEFSKECEDELFDSKEHIYNFYSKDENYNKLLNAELGDNLLRKYATKTLVNALNEIIDFSINVILEMIPKDHIKRTEIEYVLESSRIWLRNLYMFDALFDWEKEKNKEPIISLKYDIPNWFNNNNESIFKYNKKTNYKMKYSKKNEKLKNELNSLFNKSDKNFSLGKYFHQMNYNVDDIQRSSVKVLS